MFLNFFFFLFPGTGAIIISPTRELSMQTFSVLKELMEDRSQTLGLIMGGADRRTEVEKLGKGKNLGIVRYWIKIRISLDLCRIKMISCTQ